MWLGAAHQLGGEIARHAGPAGRFSAYLGLPGCQYGVEAGRHTIPITVVPGHLVGQPRWENEHRAFIALENDLGAGDRIDLSGQRLRVVIVELIEIHEYQIATVFGLVDIVDAAQQGRLVGMGLCELAWSRHVQPVITERELVSRLIPLALPGDIVATADKILEHYPN